MILEELLTCFWHSLQWYLTDWTQTTNKIDYAIDSVVDKNNLTVLRLKRKELMPMPLEILVVLKNGKQNCIISLYL